MKGYKSNQQLLRDLKTYVNKYGVPTNLTKTFKTKNGLCSWETYESHLGGKLVDWLDMIDVDLTDEERFKISTRGIPNSLSKSECIMIIRQMQSRINRPLMYDDFRGSCENHIGITQIRKYWGTLNNMKEELNLEVVHDSMIDKSIKSKKEFENICEEYSRYLFDNKINSITTNSMNDINEFPRYCTLDKYSKRFFGIPITTYLKDKHNINFGKQGNGRIYIFKDGERTVSQWEYMLSTFLRDNGLVYGHDYFRNVKYSSIDIGYNGHMDCDYKLILNGKVIFIELAGMLNCKKYVNSYINNVPLVSKSKETYRQKLIHKREIFERNNLEYYILFPNDMNIKNYKSIMRKYVKEVT